MRRSFGVGLTGLVLVASACSGGEPPERASSRPAPAASVGAIADVDDAATFTTVADSERVRLRFRPAAYDGWLDAIPESVSLTSGAHDVDGDVVRDLGPVRDRLCGRDPFRVRDVVERRTLAWSFSPTDTEARDLRLFADDRSAARFQRRALDLVDNCPTQQHDGTTSRHAARSIDLGDSAFTIMTTYTRRSLLPQVKWSDVIRTGNAVLITHTIAPYLPGPSLRRALSTHRQDLREVVAEMCVFTPGGCPVADPDIPDGFPLAAGFPDNDQAEGPGSGLAGPSRVLPEPVWTLCGAELPLPTSRDRMAAQWSNPEDYRQRQLYTFVDADEAIGFVGRLTDFWRSCPRESENYGYRAVQSVVPTRTGGQSVALVRSHEHDGEPGLGIEIEHVVRVGRAVLLDEVSNEGWLPSLDDYLQSMTNSSAPVLGAMCAFTEAGC